MADGGFLLRRCLRKRAVVRRIEKDRIVAEAAVAFRLARDASFDGSARLEHDASVPRERERADEARRTVERLAGAERVVDERELSGITERLAAVARRVHTRRAAERVDLEP